MSHYLLPSLLTDEHWTIWIFVCGLNTKKLNQWIVDQTQQVVVTWYCYTYHRSSFAVAQAMAHQTLSDLRLHLTWPLEQRCYWHPKAARRRTHKHQQLKNITNLVFILQQFISKIFRKFLFNISFSSCLPVLWEGATLITLITLRPFNDYYRYASCQSALSSQTNSKRAAKLFAQIKILDKCM